MTSDLYHIYHRPGELFWLECDPFQRAVPCWQDAHPLRKTETEWVLRSNYGYGWEDESAAKTWPEMRQLLKEYRENAPQGQYRAVKRQMVKAQYA